MTTTTNTAAAIDGLACIRCGRSYGLDIAIDSRGCPACRDEAPANLAVTYAPAPDAPAGWPAGGSHRGMARFASFLPIPAEDMVRLGEGDTPMVRLERLGERLGIGALYSKDESRNPTWSHKDRFSCIAVSHARRIGAPLVATASSGNAGASLAAYAAKAGLPCIVLTFQGAAGPMVEQIRRYGAMVVPLRLPEDRWPVLAEGVRRFGWFGTSPFAAPVVGSHPVGIEGYKTIAYELFEQFDEDAPDWIVVPTSYGDVLAGIWRGLQDLASLGLIRRLPKMAVAETYGSVETTIAAGSEKLAAMRRNFESRAVSIGTSQGTFQSLQAVRQSGGAAVTVDDADLLRLQDETARSEGILGELSSIAAFAAARQLRERGAIKGSDRVVCLMTSTGLKDLDKTAAVPWAATPVEGGMDAALRYLAERYDFDPSRSGPVLAANVREPVA